MPSTQFPGDAQRGAALLDLHRRVGRGEGFANACAAVAHRFEINPDELRQAYDDACRELARACRELHQPRNREPLEGMLYLGDIGTSLEQPQTAPFMRQRSPA